VSASPTASIERDIGAFVRSIEHYFRQSLSQVPEIGTPYLVDTRSQFGGHYTGIIAVSGRRSGCIWFTAPRGLLNVLLMAHGETEISEQNMLDLVGEVANTLCGNVRSEFGRDFRISVPQVVAGEPEGEERPANARAIVVPIHVRNHEARLVVALS
jgi:chemotaxis protein CheX